MNAFIPLANFWRWISRQPYPCLDAAPMHLDRRDTLSRTLCAGQTLLCVRGALWITSDADERDILLQEGDRFSPAQRTHLVIEALDDSVVRW